MTRPSFDCIRNELQLVEEKLLQAIQVKYEPLNALLRGLFRSGGKRLRPALVMLAARLYDMPDVAPAVALASAVEMLHTATLVHDDLIDGASVRRSANTVNATFSAGATVLAGDYLFSHAAAMAAQTENLRVVKIFADIVRTICNGELQQMFTPYVWRQPKEHYYQRIYAKTASLFAAATESGAILAQAPEQAIQTLRGYGCQLGMAFQIVDDVLDLVGDAKQMGKPVGNDLRQGTVTLPLFYYLQDHALQEVEPLKAPPGEKRDEALRLLVERVKSSSAPEAALAEARDFAAQAKALLRELHDCPCARVMADLADYVVEREN